MIDEIEGELCLSVAPFYLLFQAIDAPLQAVEVGEHELGLDGVDIGDRVNTGVHVGDVGILEAAHHMRNGVDLADHGEKLVAEPLAPGGAADKPGDVNESDPGRHDLG